MASPPWLCVKNLNVSVQTPRGRRLVIKNLSMSLQKNETLCLVGRSGSGKSLLASALIGLCSRGVRKESGEIIFFGESIDTFSYEKLRKFRGGEVATIFQEPSCAMNPTLSIRGHFQELFRAHNITGTKEELKQRAEDLIYDVGLPNPRRFLNAYPYELSLGQLQRLMIGMVLAPKPKILIADEITSSLDVTAQAKIISLISVLQKKRDMSVFWITHDFGVVNEVADRVMVMSKGEIVEEGDSQSLLNSPKESISQKLIQAVPKLEVHKETRSAPKESESSPFLYTFKAGTMPLLRVSNLKKTFKKQHLFSYFQEEKGEEEEGIRNINFDLQKGEVIAVVGDSGAGKSTLARTLVRILKPQSGEILIEGQDISSLSQRALKPFRAKIQMVFQDPYHALNPSVSIGNSVAEGLLIQGVKKSEAYERSEEHLKQMGLGTLQMGRYPHQFSGGERQRIVLARAMAIRPKLLICDEVIASLDTLMQKTVLSFLKKAQKEQNISMLFITHNLRSALEVADRVMVMHRGVIVENKSAQEILNHPEHEYTRLLLDSIPGV